MKKLRVCLTHLIVVGLVSVSPWQSNGGAAYAEAFADSVRIDSIHWNSTIQVFEVYLSAQQVVVDYRALFEMKVGVRIRAGGVLVGEGGPVVGSFAPSPTGAPDAQVYVSLDPIEVPWDRNGGTFDGTANVAGRATLVGNQGRLVEKGMSIGP